MRVSAVIPNYNHAHLIPAALGSLGRQALAFDEIVVVDDGSSDHSVDVVNSLAATDPRIRLVRHSANLGTVTALNTGLRVAQGEFVHFGAADDIFRPDLTARTVPLLEAHPEAALACGEVLLVDRSRGAIVGLRPPILPSRFDSCFSPAAVALLLRHMDNFIVTPAAVFRRKLVIEAGGFNKSFGPFTDGYLVRQLALKHGFCFSPAVLAEWRVDDAGYSRTLARTPERSLEILYRATAAMRADPRFPHWYPALFERRWRFAVERLSVQETEASGWRRQLQLVQLTLRHRPLSLTKLATTFLLRHLRTNRTGQ